MTFTVLSLFPKIINAYFADSIMAKAVDKGLIAFRAIDIRDYALDKHRKCDDSPYGGGAGMLMLGEPLGRALEAVGVDARHDRTSQGLGRESVPGRPDGALLEMARPEEPSQSAALKCKARAIYLSPSGRPFTQKLAADLAREDELILVCGRYEGVDQRIIDLYIDDEISIGDYVLSSGEVAALVLIDSVYRLVDGVIASESLWEESFNDGLLEYPQYTRPEVYANLRVPEILLSGHHEQIRRWRLRERVKKTLAVRPELIRRGLERGIFNAEIIELIKEAERENASPGSGA